MKVACKLTRNGNSTTVTIPRRVLAQLRWLTGDQVILEVTDVDTITVHPPRVADLRVAGVIGVIAPRVPELAK
jgi:antitoxin component of MazEF toxin-antitoxin module